VVDLRILRQRYDPSQSPPIRRSSLPDILLIHTYNKQYSSLYTDTLPVELDIKLRVNRRDLTLPDTHGQIWLQLVSAFDRDPTLFSAERNVNKKGIEKRMLDILCLTSEARFPISRLVTLWRSERWRPRITRWCRTSLGRTTFNISKWYQIAGYRLDDVSNSPLISVMDLPFIHSPLPPHPRQSRIKPYLE
jgi:hypothetical protein